MAAVAMRSSSSSSGGAGNYNILGHKQLTSCGGRRGGANSSTGGVSKYVRYTTEQVEELERVYRDCPKPSSLRRQQLVRECPILSNIHPKQIKVWFQNRRCRDKQKEESCRLQAVNRRLTAMNKLLMEENERLQKQVAQLIQENAFMRQQLKKASLPSDDLLGNTLHNNPPRDANDPAGLLSIAEETLAEFLSKATGTAVDWVQMPGMKPGPDSIGIFGVSQSCSGVAARVCSLVNLEPAKIVDILKDRPTWFRDCRHLEVFTKLPAGNGGMIELVYMQLYAPTTLAPARDFWTLRYTTNLEDGSIAVCERSLGGSGGGGNSSTAHQFVRAEMHPSGFLIRQCEGGGSIVHIVDHLDLEAWKVPEVLRPLYESSRVLAHKLTAAALHHLRQIAQETSSDVTYALGRQPALLRTYSQRLSRGFNDAVNGFKDDGWSLKSCDGLEDVIISTNSSKKISSHGGSNNDVMTSGGVICAKASMLLQNVPPALLIRFLREHRSEWADFTVDSYSAASLRASSGSLAALKPARFSGNQIIMPLAHNVENEECLEVVRLESQLYSSGDTILSQDIHLLQLCSGIDENDAGASFELIFAPISELSPENTPLLPSGFGLYHWMQNQQAGSTSHRTLDLASSLEQGSASNYLDRGMLNSCLSARSVLTIAFQLPYEVPLQDDVVMMAGQYIRSIVSAVQRVSMAITPVQPGLDVARKLAPASPEAPTLAQWICHSYSYNVGLDLLKSNCEVGDALLKLLWHHQDAIICCCLKDQPNLIFANQAGLDMLETTLVALQDITLDKIFDENGKKLLCSEFSKLMQQGYAYLPGGVALSGMGRQISYEQAVAWKVLGEDGTLFCLAFSFMNWSFL